MGVFSEEKCKKPENKQVSNKKFIYFCDIWPSLLVLYMKCISQQKEYLMRYSTQEAFEKYRDNIYAIAFNYFRNRQDAEDAVQEVFLKYHRTGKDFDSADHIRNWLIRVAINECKNVTLSSWFKKREPLAEYEQTLCFEEPEESRLFESVMALSRKYRSVLHLFYYEDYSVREIAELLGISESAVTTRLARGRNKLKKELKEVWADE